MPLYDYECKICGKMEERYCPMEDSVVYHCTCGGDQNRVLSARYNINRAVNFVTDDISGEPVSVTSKRQLKTLCDEHGVHEKYGKGWT
jgi:putative FmdB family regulatory protein